MFADGGNRQRNKKGAPTTAAPQTPAKAHTEQHNDRRPLAGARIKLLLLYERSLAASVWRFLGKQYLTLARQFEMYDGPNQPVNAPSNQQ